MSHARCRMSRVTFPVSHVTIWFFGLLVEGLLSTGPTLSSFTIEPIYFGLRNVSGKTICPYLDIVKRGGSDEHKYSNIQIFEWNGPWILFVFIFVPFPQCEYIQIFIIRFFTTKYNRLFVCKFYKMSIYLNICAEPYFDICLSIFNKKVNLDIFYASKISSVKLYL